MLAVWLFVAFWVVVAFVLFFVAARGGLGGARATLQSQRPGARKAATVLFVVAFVGFGVAMPIGFLVPAVLMVATRNLNYLGAAAVVVAAPLAALPILDTTLVMVSRARRGAPLLSGGRDHLTHRLLRIVGSPQRVALVLAAAQAAFCGLGLALLSASEAVVLSVGSGYIALGAAAVMLIDRAPSLQPEWLQAARSERAARARELEAVLLRAPAQQESAP